MAIQIRRGLVANLGSWTPVVGEPAMTTDQPRAYLGTAGVQHLVGCKSHIAATTAPTVNDDAGDGYSVNSFWCDVTADIAYICLDSSVGAAVWQALAVTDPELAAIAALTSAADKGIQFTGSGTAATFDLTAAGKALLDDADAAAQRATLGLTIGTHVQAYDAELAAIAGLTSAADKGIQFTGSGTAATYDLTTAGKALLDDADAAAQRATLGLAIGTNVQAYSADLAAIAALSPSNDDVIQRKAGAWTNRTVAQLKTDLGIVAASETASGIIELATTTEVQTGTDTTRAVTPASLHSAIIVPKGWVNFTMVGAGGTIKQSHNVSSLTDVGVGNYRVVWDSDFASAYQCTLASAALSGTTTFSNIGAASAQTAGQSAIVCANTAGTLVDADIACVAAMGAW